MTSKIFKDKSCLSLDYIPKEIKVRKNLIEELKHKIECGQRVNLVGGTGTGKTLSILLASKKTKKYVLYVNCLYNPSYTDVTKEIVSQINPSVKVKKGISRREIWEVLNRSLSGKIDSLVIILDEIDNLFKKSSSDRDHSDILYQLSEKSNLSLIFISNDMNWDSRLDERTRSRMNMETKLVSSYSSDEIFEILLQRSELSFYKGVIKFEELDKISQYSAETKGDVRISISLLIKSGELAEKKEMSRITSSLIDEAISKLDIDDFLEKYETLSLNEKLFLMCVSVISLKNKHQVAPQMEVWNMFRNSLKESSKRIPEFRTFQNHQERLKLYGFIETDSFGLGRGRGKQTNIVPKFPIHQFGDYIKKFERKNDGIFTNENKPKNDQLTNENKPITSENELNNILEDYK